MVTYISWNEAIKDYLIRDEANHSQKTRTYHRTHLNAIAAWSDSKGIALESFGKRHMDEYIKLRREQGRSPKTRRHDVINIKTFLKWCVHYNILERNLLNDYPLPAVPKKEKVVPKSTDMLRLFEVALEFWDPKKNPHVRNSQPAKRSFHRERNYAIMWVMLVTGCRINEVLSLKIDDYKVWKEKGVEKVDIFLAETKSNEQAFLPITPLCHKAVSEWLKVRQRVMKQVPESDDEGWLFISESGRMIDNSSFRRVLNRYADFGNTRRIKPHDFRSFAITEWADINLLFAQKMARHKDPKTTLQYVGLHDDFLRGKQAELDVDGKLFNQTSQPTKKKRLQFS